MDQSSKLVGRRSFLVRGALIIGSVALTTLSDRRTFGSAQHRYKLVPESILPADIRQAPADVGEAYRFAVANRDPLRYIASLEAFVSASRVTPENDGSRKNSQRHARPN